MNRIAMKMQSICIGLAALALCVVAMSAVPMRAQDQAPPPPQGGGMGRMTPEQQVDQLTKELSLTPDQATKVTAIVKDQMSQMTALRGDDTLSQEDRRDKMMKIRTDTQTKIKALLTDDQKPKYDAFLAKQASRGPRGGGNGGGSAPPPQ